MAIHFSIINSSNKCGAQSFDTLFFILLRLFLKSEILVKYSIVSVIFITLGYCVENFLEVMTGKTCFSGCVIFAITLCDIINLWNHFWKFDFISRCMHKRNTPLEIKFDFIQTSQSLNESKSLENSYFLIWDRSFLLSFISNSDEDQILTNSFLSIFFHESYISRLKSNSTRIEVAYLQEGDKGPKIHLKIIDISRAKFRECVERNWSRSGTKVGHYCSPIV